MSQSLTSFSTVQLLFVVQLLGIALASRHAGRTGVLAYPAWIGVLLGIPDLLFGLSALVMVWLAAKRRVTSGALLVWNLLGMLVILPGAPLIGQMGLPDHMHVIEETPSITTLFAFPMVLAPSVVVPVFVMMNLLVAHHHPLRCPMEFLAQYPAQRFLVQRPTSKILA